MPSRLARCAGPTILAAALALPGNAAPVNAAPAGVSSAPPVVAARKSKRSSRREKKTKKRRSKARRNNMPKGWSWPPTPAMKKVGQACLDELDTLGVAWKKAPAARKVTTPITLTAMELAGVRLVSTYRKGPFVMDCHLARGLAMHSSALQMLGVATLRFSQIHDYRTIERNGRRTNILSRHAIGLAMDVRGLVLTDGTELDVEEDYGAGPNALHSVEALMGSVEEFRTPLTPGNDPRGHDDHFHFEAQMPLAE
jgi:hypothetical protein